MMPQPNTAPSLRGLSFGRERKLKRNRPLEGAVGGTALGGTNTQAFARAGARCERSASFVELRTKRIRSSYVDLGTPV